MATDHSTVKAAIAATARRWRKAKDALDAAERDRDALYERARALDPPLTFKEIGEPFGVTPAAVMQKLGRATETCPKPKRRKSAAA